MQLKWKQAWWTYSVCLVNISINRSVKVPFEPSYIDLEAHPLVEIDMPIDKYSYIMDDWEQWMDNKVKMRDWYLIT